MESIKEGGEKWRKREDERQRGTVRKIQNRYSVNKAWRDWGSQQ